MNETIPYGASLLPFQVSKSKRIAEAHMKTFHGGRTFRNYWQNTMMTSDLFGWLVYPEVKKGDFDNGLAPYRIIPISSMLIKSIGIYVKSNRRLCFGGEPLFGITMPLDELSQSDLIKKLVIWFSPCIEDDTNSLKLNRDCFKLRHVLFSKMYLHSLRDLRNMLID